MANFSHHSNILEIGNNLLHFFIDWYEDLARDSDHTFCYHRNILNFVYAVDSTPASFSEDIATGQRHWAQPGQLTLIPLHRKVRLFWDEGTRFVSLHFGLEFVRGVDLFEGANQFFTFEDTLLVNRIRALDSAIDPIAAMLIMRSEVMNICLRCLPELPTQNRSLKTLSYAPLLADIALNIDAGTTVETLATGQSCCRETFSRNFQRDLGIAPTTWLHRVLADRVAQMLDDTDLNLQMIAQKLAFSSEFYLSRFFKRETGLSPRQYRNRCRVILPNASTLP